MLLVSLDNHLHEAVAHDIFFGEIDELDVLDAREHALASIKPLRLPVGRSICVRRP